MSQSQQGNNSARAQMRPGSMARIPSNLRIRRPRDTSLGAVIAPDSLPEEDLEDQRSAIFGDSSRGNRQQQGGERRSAPTRRLGVIEKLAREDRRAAQQQQQQRQDNTHNGDSGSNVSTSPADRALPMMRGEDRPRLFARGSDARLPALKEVSSPIETQFSSLDEGAVQNRSDGDAAYTPSVQTDAFATANSQTEVPQHDYFPASAAKDGKKEQKEGVVLPRTTSLPPITSTRAKRNDVDVPTPLTERSETMYEDDDDHHAAEVADYLDVVDAEVGTLGYLTNIQNSIFVPNIPALYDRRPVHDLPRSRKRSSTLASITRRGSVRRGSATDDQSRRGSTSSQLDRPPSDLEQGQSIASGAPATTAFSGGEKMARAPSRQSILTRMTSAVGLGPKKQTDEELEYAKHIREWRTMDEDERNELDEHVKLVLRKKAKIRRGLKGFWAFFKTPMGFIMTMYGFLITFWGTAIMLFIFSWIKVGERRRYWIEICDQILCALFAAVGLGFAPFRAVDTYRMIWIAKMHYRTWERRKALGLNELQDPNDLPRPEDDGSNQVARVQSQTGGLPTRKRLSAGPISGGGQSNDIEMTANGSGGRESSLDSGEGESSVKSPTRTPKHWWDLKKQDEPLSPGQRNLLSPQSSHVSGGSGSQHKKTKEGHFVVPERSTEDQEDPTGKTGDLRRKVGQPHPQLKRNDSIKSELVKEREDIVVLTKAEQELLQHHQRKFHQSHSFYRFHETATHRAFPLDLMITIVCLLDCHSLLQGALGGCTWGIKYTHRPTVLTATLISCSLSCNAVAGLLIYIGGRKTKKREEVERRLRIALEAMALEKIERRRARGELPERNAMQHSASHSKDSGASRDDAERSASSDASGDEEQQRTTELRSAVDTAARVTEDVDQSQYDEVEDSPRQARSSSLRAS